MCIRDSGSTGQELNHASHMAVCPGCGAHNIVIGDGSQCEYCGTILH